MTAAAAPPAAPTALVGLPPLCDERCRVWVLGSFPGVASLAAQQYYGHPQNQFWRLLQDLFALPAGLAGLPDYPARTAWLQAQGLGLWDVYAACERQGSLDSAIRQAQPNDLAGLRERCPALRAIVHNGAESYKHHPITAALGVPVHKLPSTSPANASIPYATKLAQWRAVLSLYLDLR